MSIKKFTLSNGITVINDRRNIDTASFQFLVKTGAAYETKQFGISHLTEHLMFKATDKRTSNQVNSEIKFTGAMSNAFTDHGYTCFFFESLTKHFEIVLDVYADFLTHKNIPDHDFKKEKDVVLQEIAMYKDNDTDVNFDNAYKRIFGLRPVGGSASCVKKIKLKDVYQYIAATYIPKNILISVCSKFSNRKIKKLLEKHFKCIQATTRSYEDYDFHPEFRIEEKFNKVKGTTKKVKKGLNQTRVVLFVPLAKDYSIKTKLTRDILLQIFSRGLSSVLYTQLREEMGLIYRCSADIFYETVGFKQPYLLISTSTEPKNIKPLIRELNRVMVLLSTYITEKDVQKALNCIEMQSTKFTAYSYANDNIANYLNHGLVKNDRYYEKIMKSITYDDVVNEAKSWGKEDFIIQMLGN